MNFRQLAVLVLAGTVLTLPAPASTRYMPIEEVKPGMTGVGRAVFKGTAIEEFRAHILGVLRSSVVGPQRDLIIARLSGGPLAKTGVIAGMSGSPVYVDGRLIGAVGYSVGSFATEPIAGITPIGEMVEATARGGEAGPARITPIPIGSPMSALVAAFDDVLRPARAFVPLAWPAGSDARALDLRDAASLRPIALPIAVGGLDGTAAARVLSPLGGAGFVLLPAGGRVPQNAPAGGEPLRPGDAVGVALITGDYRLGAVGTITDVEGSRVLAFGHPFYNVGPASYAMTRAYVHDVLPSLNSSMYLASLGEVVGTMQQDRATAVAGTFGESPRTIGMSVSLKRDGAPDRRFSFALAEHPLLTPLLANVAVAGVLSQYERDSGPATYALRGRAAIAGHAALEFSDIYAGDQPGFAVASAVAMPLAALLTNALEPVRVESLQLEIEGAERIRSATIERVWLDTTDVKAGKTVPVKILLAPWRGEPFVRTIEVDIPRNAGGPLTLVVADGVRFGQWEQREQRAALRPATVDQMLKVLNASRRASRIYVRLVGRDTGAVINGEAMPSLPSSVLAVMQGDRGAAVNPPLHSSVLGAWEIPMDIAVEGLRTLALTLTDRRP